MKTKIQCALILLAIAALPSISLASPVRKPAIFHTMYAPGGFDSNDNVQLVGEGLFANSCYRPAPSGVKVDVDKKTITVAPTSYEYNGFCLQVILPFDRVVDVGIVPAGNYKVIQSPSNDELGTLTVAASKSQNPDDHIYAPISQAFFRQKGAVSEILIAGDFPNSCMTLDEVKVAIEPKVIVVLPIAKMETRPDCKDGKFPFNKVVSVDLVPKGRYLLHVRSMNSKAINNLVDVSL